MAGLGFIDSHGTCRSVCSEAAAWGGYMLALPTRFIFSVVSAALSPPEFPYEFYTQHVNFLSLPDF